MADWTGQKRAEAATVWLTSVFGVVAFLVGYARQDFGLMMKVYGVGVVLAGAATIPDWPWLNRHPLAWLPAAGGSGGGDESGESLGVATRRATGQRRLPVIE